MNRKTLGMLMLAPVAVFATDFAIGHDGGGGKDKKAKVVAPQAAPQQMIQELKSPGSITADADFGVEAVPTAAEKAAEKHAMRLEEVAKTIAYYESEAGMDEYHDQDYVYQYDDEIPEDDKDFLNKSVDQRLDRINPAGINVVRSYSRCPSGYHYVLMLDKDKNVTNEGYMVIDDGCWDRPLARFKYDLEKRTVLAKISNKAGYTSMYNFFKLYKEAQG